MSQPIEQAPSDKYPSERAFKSARAQLQQYRGLQAKEAPRFTTRDVLGQVSKAYGSLPGFVEEIRSIDPKLGLPPIKQEFLSVFQEGIQALLNVPGVSAEEVVGAIEQLNTMTQVVLQGQRSEDK